MKCPQVALRDPLLVSCPLPLCLLQPAPLPKAHIARAILPPFTTFPFLYPCPQRMLIWQCPLLTASQELPSAAVEREPQAAVLMSLGGCPIVVLLETEQRSCFLSHPQMWFAGWNMRMTHQVPRLMLRKWLVPWVGHLGKGTSWHPEKRTGS